MASLQFSTIFKVLSLCQCLFVSKFSVSPPATTIDSLAAEDSLHLDAIVDPCQLEDRSWWPSAPLGRERVRLNLQDQQRMSCKCEELTF